ncbi:hypothetical protein, partial [Streptomyces sp. RM99]|uniref:hypothetical protein n=1 Tax=Streptomyces sp. RM99 TaxID=2824897 RepID=UPI001B364792
QVYVAGRRRESGIPELLTLRGKEPRVAIGRPVRRGTAFRAVVRDAGESVGTAAHPSIAVVVS